MMIGSRSGHARALVFLAAVVAVSSAAAQYKGTVPHAPAPSHPSPIPLPHPPSLVPSPGPVLPAPSPIPPSPLIVPRQPSLEHDIDALSRRIGELFRDGKYAEAIPLADRYVDVATRLAGDDNPSYAAAIGWRAMLHRAQGHYTVAEPLIKRALAIDEKALGPDHLNVAAHLDNLAQLYQEQGRYAEAEPLYSRALAIAEKQPGAPDQPRVGTALNNLAWLYQAQGRYEEAEPLVRRALAIVEKELGPDDVDVGRTLDTLAKLHEGQGRFEEAEKQYRRALAILEKALVSDHPEVGIVRGNAGGLYKAQKRLAEAEPLLESALAISEKTLGPKHPSVARSLTQVGDLYRLKGQCGKADGLFLRARNIGAEAIKEVAVLFGTDRMPNTTLPTVAFGGDRSPKLSLGLTIVTLPKETAGAQPVAPSGPEILSVSAQTTEVRRLAMHCIQIANEKEIVEAARRRLDEAKDYAKQALVFVHGYNVSFESALRRAAQISYDIGFDGGTFAFSWPVHEGSFAWLWDYLSAGDTVDPASEHLKQFLERVVAKTGAAKIHFVAHSMGNMVLLRALEKIIGENPAFAATIGEVINAAPDVDPDTFVLMVRKVKAKGAGLTLYASRSDKALKASGWLRYRPRAGYILDKPLIVRDTADEAIIADTIDITSAGSSGWYDLFALDHDLYSSNPIIVGDIGRIIREGKRPPSDRTKEFEAVAAQEGTYWKLTPAQKAEQKR
jgi:esterase/lipase superfamily enzyme